MADVERRVKACLADDIAGHCRVAGVGDGSLRLVTDSPAWAARLRFQGTDLLRRLERECGLALRQVRVQVTPAAAPSPTPRRPIRLSDENAQLLDRTARTIGDPALARALKRLARHAGAPRR